MKRGNTTDYASADELSLESDNLDEEFLKDCWRARVKQDPLRVKYNDLTDFSFSEKKGSPTCEVVLKTLRMFAAATGDDVFTSAARAMEAHGFHSGGAKKAAGDYLKRHGAEWLIVHKMHAWRQRNLSKREAAFRTAAQNGIVGPSWEAVIDRLEKAYDQWLLEIGNKASSGGS